MVYYSSAEIFQHGIFYGYTPVVVTIISLQSVGGLVVAATIKYADNILKGKAAINYIFLLVGTPVWVLRCDCISRFGVWMLVCQSQVRFSDGALGLWTLIIGRSKYSMFAYFPKFSYIPLKLRFILALSNSPKIRSAMFTEDGNIGGNGNMFLGNFRGLQT